MRDALRAAGLDARVFAPGDVWYVEDPSIQLPETPKGQTTRSTHGTRPMIVVDGPRRCADGTLVSILAVPTTTRRDLASPYRLTIPKGEGGLDESIAMIDLVQPIKRSAFRVKVGQLSHEKLFEVMSILLDNVGVLPSDPEPPPADEAIDVDDIPF